MELIKKLNLSFGIGVISLDSVNIAQSKILANAKFKENLDLNVMNELVQKNPNFKKFMKTIKDYDPENQTRYDCEFDKILAEVEFEKYLKEKLISLLKI